jgi:hypothetical protein
MAQALEEATYDSRFFLISAKSILQRPAIFGAHIRGQTRSRGWTRCTLSDNEFSTDGDECLNYLSPERGPPQTDFNFHRSVPEIGVDKYLLRDYSTFPKRHCQRFRYAQISMEPRPGEP